jgi:hypothetical protein
MLAAGYPYSSPATAASKFRESAKPKASRQEIETAVAEANCANSTGMAEIVRQLDKSYAAALRTKNRSYVETDERLASDALPRARAIIRQLVGPTGNQAAAEIPR